MFSIKSKIVPNVEFMKQKIPIVKWIALEISLWIFQLNRYIEKLTNEMKEAGNLEGILLTGLTKDGVDLMESYVDRTGDVQTASYCMLQVSAVWQQQFIKEKKNA